MITTPILATKLHIPPPRTDAIRRPRLLDQLNAGLSRKLTLISAAAGFGKTTLLSTWIDSGERPAAWLSLDERDGDPVRFITYLIAALQTIDATIGQTVMEAMETAQQPAVESLLTPLLNDLTAITGEVLLVLDDYHLLESAQVDAALDFLLTHLPPQLHLVIATREDPQLPLARLRVRGQLTELRVADLRFSADEAADFLNHAMGLALTPDDITALEQRTEGWIAGLQLAALSIQGRDDSADFIEAFTGSHRFVLDYLVEEVLHRQPENVRDFLLQTSILDRLNGALCDAVTDAQDSQKMLETLERGNLFVVPLDHTRRWYRYHHLFADAIHAHLHSEQADSVNTLHLRACDWYAAHDLPHEAIHHALAAHTFDRAADLIEDVWYEMDQAYQSQAWMRWARALPEQYIHDRPQLSLGVAWGLLNQGQMDTAERYLHNVEQHPGAANIDDSRLRGLQAAVASARAYAALTSGDTTHALEHAQRAITLSAHEDDASYRQGLALTAIVQWKAGDLHAADDALHAFMESMWRSNVISDALPMAFVLTDIRLATGRLRDALTVCEQNLARVAGRESPAIIGLADVYRSLAELHIEQGDMATASAAITQAETLGEETTLTNWRYRYCITRAHFEATQGDYAAALTLLDEADSVLTPAPLPIVRPAAAMKARLWLKQGDIKAAFGWVRSAGVAADDPLSYVQEYAHITLARVMLGQYQRGGTDTLDTALHLLERLHTAAESGGRDGTRIEIQILMALVCAAQGDTAAALEHLRGALTLAEPEGYVRVFTAEGEPLKALITAADTGEIAPTLMPRLRAAFGQSTPAPSDNHPLLEPLSDRELDVLRLLPTELSGPEIARELMVSLNTMRTHTKNIYSKLGVNNRRAAVRRAEELGLV